MKIEEKIEIKHKLKAKEFWLLWGFSFVTLCLSYQLHVSYENYNVLSSIVSALFNEEGALLGFLIFYVIFSALISKVSVLLSKFFVPFEFKSKEGESKKINILIPSAVFIVLVNFLIVPFLIEVFDAMSH